MKLNFKTIAYFASGLVMIGAPIALIKSSHYTPRFEENENGQHKSQSWGGAAEYYMILKADPATGLINEEARTLAENEAALRMIIGKNQKTSNTNALSLNWSELGPDNIGGRTRAICFDKNHQGVVFAGGNSGGIFKSTDGGSTWNPVNDQLSNMIIDCMSQDATGDNIYFGTGESQGFINGDGNSAFVGSGLFKLNIATNIVTSVTTTTTFKNINKVVCHKTDPNTMYLGTANNGFKITNDGGATWHPAKLATTSAIVANTGSITDIKLASDGSYIFSYGSNLFISNNGDDFVTAITPTVITSTNRSSVEIAIAPSNPNIIYLSCVNGSNLLGGVAQSIDKGLTWTKIAQSSSTTFDPFKSGGQGQGAYDNAITVDPTNPYKVFLGGASFWVWYGDNTGTGTWIYAAYQFAIGSQQYVHSDIHAFVWDPFNSSSFFVGSDGGLARTFDGGSTFASINKGYNVTQPYSVAFERYPSGGLNGVPVGGAMSGNQDNGTTYVTGTFNGPKGAYPVGGGDGNYCDFSHINPTSVFSSIYYGQVERAATTGINAGTGFYDAEYGSAAAANNGGPGSSGSFASFITPIRMYETMSDFKSIDSVDFYATTIVNNAAGVGTGSTKVFKTIVLKSNNSAIFDSMYVSLGAISTASFNVANPATTYTAVAGVGTASFVVTRRDYTTSFSGNSSTITATSYTAQAGDYDSLRISFASPPASGVAIKIEVTQRYNSGAEVKVTTKTTTGVKFSYILPANVAARNSIRLPDIVQARLAVGITGKVFVVKKPLNFGVTPDWVQVASGLSKDENNASSGFNGTVHTMAWSSDGNHLYVGTDGGSLFRISHLHGLIDSVGNVSSLPSVDANFNGINTTGNAANPNTKIRCTRIGVFGAVITSISVNPNDTTSIVVTTGTYSNPKVYYATNPTTHTVTSGVGAFIDKSGTGTTGLIATAPKYSSLIEYKDTKRVIVGTEYGVYGTSDITVTNPIWVKENNSKLPNVPVFMLRQQINNSAACYNSGMIYAGTHGRGIWTCDNYYNQTVVGIEEIAAKDKTVVSAIKLYPNPAKDFVNVTFNIEKSESLMFNLYDLKGGLVISKNLGKLPEGEQLMQIGTEDLISGTYIVSLNSSSAIVGTNRLVVIK
jgi:hypothetical protein